MVDSAKKTKCGPSILRGPKTYSNWSVGSESGGAGYVCHPTHPTMAILQQILLIGIGGLLALGGTLLAAHLQARRERLMLDREDRRAETERVHARYKQSVQDKRDAYFAFATAIHHASLALDNGPLPDDRLNELTRLHEAVLLVAPENIRQATIQTFDRFLKAKDAMEFPHLQEKRKSAVAQNLGNFRRLAREDLGLHNVEIPEE